MSAMKQCRGFPFSIFESFAMQHLLLQYYLEHRTVCVCVCVCVCVSMCVSVYDYDGSGPALEHVFKSHLTSSDARCFLYIS